MNPSDAARLRHHTYAPAHTNDPPVHHPARAARLQHTIELAAQ